MFALTHLKLFSLTSFAVVETKKPNGIANGKKKESSSEDSSSDEETDKKSPAKTGKLNYSLNVDWMIWKGKNKFIPLFFLSFKKMTFIENIVYPLDGKKTKLLKARRIILWFFVFLPKGIFFRSTRYLDQNLLLLSLVQIFMKQTLHGCSLNSYVYIFWIGSLVCIEPLVIFFNI